MIEAEKGDLDITVDRKLHAELKMISFKEPFGEEQSSMLSGWTDLPEATECVGIDRIKKLTDATKHVQTESHATYDLFQCEVLNATEEPDSRFEAKTGNMKRGGTKEPP